MSVLPRGSWDDVGGVYPGLLEPLAYFFGNELRAVGTVQMLAASSGRNERSLRAVDDPCSRGAAHCLIPCSVYQ
jgi:hypothetical protein